MKIAIAFFGIPRNSAVTYPSIDKYFIETANRYGECRLFHHLYYQERVINPRSNEDAPMPFSSYLAFANSNGFIEEPSACFDEDQFKTVCEFGDAFGDQFRSLRNLMLQLTSLNRVNKLVEDYSPDIVLYLRPDLLYRSGFSIYHLNALAKNPSLCIIPEWQWWGGYNDRFAFCGSGVSGAYATRIEVVRAYCEVGDRPVHAEALLRFAMKRVHASIRATTIRANRVRLGRGIQEEEFSPLLTVGGARHLRIENRMIRYLSYFDTYYRNELKSANRKQSSNTCTPGK